MDIDALLNCDAPLFTYSEVGATAHDLKRPPHPGYDLDHHRFRIGAGRQAFERAQAALLAWRHFEIPWLELHGADNRAHSGQVVATLVSVAGLWFLNPCRVVYAEPGDSNRVCFAYGTLPGHVERGEERFAVSYSPSTEEVHYEVTAFSRPATLLTRLGYPLARRLQRRFVVSSARALEGAAA